MKKCIFLLIVFCVTFNGYSQITTNEQPVSLSLYSEKNLQYSNGGLLECQPISLPIPDMETIYAEDVENDKKIGNAFRVSIRIPVSYNSKENGKWTTLELDGHLAYMLSFVKMRETKIYKR